MEENQIAHLLTDLWDDLQRPTVFWQVGVFISFTMSQAGIFTRWFKEKSPGWHYKSIINGIGAFIAYVVPLFQGLATLEL